MKLSDYARQMGVRYETAWRWYRDGNIPGRRVGPRTIIMTKGQEAPAAPAPKPVAIYARASSAENKSNLDGQAERLSAYCTARGYQVAKVVTAVGSGVNDARLKLLARLAEQSLGLIGWIGGEHTDRLTRCGFRSLDTLLKTQGRAVDIVHVVHQAENGTEDLPDDLLADLTALVSACGARLSGQRRAQRKTERMVAELEAQGEEGTSDAPG